MIAASYPQIGRRCDIRQSAERLHATQLHATQLHAGTELITQYGSPTARTRTVSCVRVAPGSPGVFRAQVPASVNFLCLYSFVHMKGKTLILYVRYRPPPPFLDQPGGPLRRSIV